MCEANNEGHSYLIRERGGDDDACEYPTQNVTEFMRDRFVMEESVEPQDETRLLESENLIVERELRKLKDAHVGCHGSDGGEERCEKWVDLMRHFEEVCSCEWRCEAKTEEEAREEHACVACPGEMSFDPEKCACFIEHVRKDNRGEEGEELGKLEYLFHKSIIADFSSLRSCEIRRPFLQNF